MAFESKFGDLLLARCQKAFVKHLERLVHIQHPTPATRGCRFLSLMTVEAAIAQALGLAATVAEVEAVPLDDTIGRPLAQDVTAPFPLPPFDNSAMDGTPCAVPIWWVMAQGA
ncbi:MAG: hypothetical protein ACWA49_06895 [Ruegeria sp.]